jgi:GntR family transcriptional regulator, rspAB operon transcriptional repressor
MQTARAYVRAGGSLPRRATSYHGLASLELLAYERLKDAIITLAFPPGMPLFEMQISNELGISKTPIHTALMQLEREGFVVTVPYKGSRVAPITLEQMTHLFELREAIESQAIRAAVRSFTEADFMAMDAILARHAEALEQREVTATYILGEELHQYIVDSRGNPHFTEIFRNTSDHRLRLRHALARAGRPARTSMAPGHPLKVAALRRGDAAEAERILAESIKDRLAEVEVAERAGLLTGLPPLGDVG